MKLQICSFLILINYICFAFSQQELYSYFGAHVQRISQAVDSGLISEGCKNQMKLYVKALNEAETWAFSMFDSMTKFPTGVLNGNVYDLGNFDECLAVSNNSLSGKYCLGTVPMTTTQTRYSLGRGGQLRTLGNDPSLSGFHFSICVPNKCTVEDVSVLYPLQHYDERYCYSKETQPQLTWGPITAITLLGVFLAISALSTAWDVYNYYKQTDPKRKLTVAFSYLTNGKKLLAVSKSPDQLLCLNGLKVISMMWVVAFHEYINRASGPIGNYLHIPDILHQQSSMFIVEATVSVDTFFVIGGLLIVYSFLKATEKGAKFNVLVFYAHRYIRLTPALAVTVLIHATLLKQLGDGPLWNSFDSHLVTPCRKHWYAALLYIQNYVHDDQACVPQSWYLSVDMQLFIISPVVLIPLRKWPRKTVMGMVALSLAGIIVPFTVAFTQELRAFMISDKDDTQKYIFAYYEQTYGRFGAYVIGMLLGYIIYEFKRGQIRINLHRRQVLLLWIVCLSGGLACIYAGYNTMAAGYNKWAHSLYIAFNRPAWALAISGIILACVTGHGGPINNFLSCSLFQFLGKVSYCFYLVHYSLIICLTSASKTTIIYEHLYMFLYFWSDFIVSVFLAVVLCLTFESPMIILEKLLFTPQSSAPKKILQ